MNRQEFIENTILQLNEELFEEMRDLFINERYISFSFFAPEEITKAVFAEKIYDYFEKTEICDSKTFERLVEKYMMNFDSVIGGKIAKEHKPTKRNPVHILPRARKYYDKADSLKKDIDLQKLVDFSRIMMCLYTEIIKSGDKEITELDYSIESIDIERILESLAKEQNNLLKKQKFDTKNHYDDDFCTFIFLIVMYYHIRNNETVGEY